MDYMKSVNYNEISEIYDDAREGDLVLIQHLIEALPSHSDARVLDIGCGTGNLTDLLQKLTEVQVYGVEPSEGMLKKARRKNKHITFKAGQADNIPFDDDFFDFAYMTDVIHHVPDIKAMFAEIWRVLRSPDSESGKSGGRGCIVTQSHQQVEDRPIARYFPNTVRVDKERYPDIHEIVEAVKAQGFTQTKSETFSEKPIELGASYLELVRKKGYSMLHLITDEEYQAGLSKLEGAIQNGPVIVQPSGGTLVWFTKA
jgi:ubiquinone/menaquinone biosynthesis C-methylase UbiE